MAKTKDEATASGSDEVAEEPTAQPGDSDVSLNEGSLAAGEAEEFPEPVPGMELAIREERAMAQAPAASLPSEREWKATIAVATEIARTPFVPQDYRGQPESVVAAILTGRELGIGPMQSLRDIFMVDGRPVFSASLMLAQMRKRGLKILESSSTAERAFIRAQRSDTQEIAEVEWTMEEASAIVSKGGKRLTEKDNWKNYPADMLWARCVGRLARRLGSDLLGGMVYAAEELRDLEGEGFGDYSHSTQAQAITWETVEPGMILHPDAPKGWQEILDVLQAVDPSRDWPWIVRTILTSKYGVERVNDLGDRFQEVGRRAANFAGYLQMVEMEGKEFPPPNDAEVISAIQWAFDGLTIEPPLEPPAVEGEEVEQGRDSDAALSPEETEQMQQAMDADEIEFGDGSAEDGA